MAEERLKAEVDLVERQLELVKAKIKAEVEVLLAAINLGLSREVGESLRRLAELVGFRAYEEPHSYPDSYLRLLERRDRLKRELEGGRY